MDFNKARKVKRSGAQVPHAEMIVFPSRTKTIAYPLLLSPDEKGNLTEATVVASFESHATHVAGIIAGNGDEIVGAAPEAEIMSLKACVGRSCPNAAITRALVEAFYNDQGLVPDVVNISLGSPESYYRGGWTC